MSESIRKRKKLVRTLIYVAAAVALLAGLAALAISQLPLPTP